MIPLIITNSFLALTFWCVGEKITNLHQLIAQQQEYITELTRMYGELPDSKHKGVSGMMKPTLKQENVAKQIEKAEARLDKLMKMLEKERE